MIMHCLYCFFMVILFVSGRVCYNVRILYCFSWFVIINKI